MCIHTLAFWHDLCPDLTPTPLCGFGYIPPRYCDHVKRALDFYHSQPQRAPEIYPPPCPRPCPPVWGTADCRGNVVVEFRPGKCDACLRLDWLARMLREFRDEIQEEYADGRLGSEGSPHEKFQDESSSSIERFSVHDRIHEAMQANPASFTNTALTGLLEGIMQDEDFPTAQSPVDWLIIGFAERYQDILSLGEHKKLETYLKRDLMANIKQDPAPDDDKVYELPAMCPTTPTANQQTLDETDKALCPTCWGTTEEIVVKKDQVPLESSEQECCSDDMVPTHDITRTEASPGPQPNSPSECPKGFRQNCRPTVPDSLALEVEVPSPRGPLTTFRPGIDSEPFSWLIPLTASAAVYTPAPWLERAYVADENGKTYPATMTTRLLGMSEGPLAPATPGLNGIHHANGRRQYTTFAPGAVEHPLQAFLTPLWQHEDQLPFEISPDSAKGHKCVASVEVDEMEEKMEPECSFPTVPEQSWEPVNVISRHSRTVSAHEIPATLQEPAASSPAPIPACTPVPSRSAMAPVPVFTPRLLSPLVPWSATAVEYPLRNPEGSAAARSIRPPSSQPPACYHEHRLQRPPPEAPARLKREPWMNGVDGPDYEEAMRAGTAAVQKLHGLLAVDGGDGRMNGCGAQRGWYNEWGRSTIFANSY